MKKRFATIFITSLVLTYPAKADMGIGTVGDFTGEAFFAPPSIQQQLYPTSTTSNKEAVEGHHTTPPIKQLRLKLQERAFEKEQRNYELAPTAEDLYQGEIETSKYASKEIEDNFEEMSPDGFESEDFSEVDEEKTKKNFFKRKKKIETSNENTENIILDCQKVDYDTNNYMIYATGDVNVEFVKQGINVKADIITFDRVNNTIKAEGDVKIIKSGKVITGDYIFVDLNEENALIENPLTKMDNIEIRSKKGYVYGDKVVQEQGTMIVNDSFPINFHTANRGPQMRSMLVPQNQTLTEDMQKGIITFQAKEIKITQKGEHEIITLKKPRLFKGDKLVFKTPSVTVYSNKNHDYVETDHWEVGSIRGLGVYAGPGFVTRLPKGSVFKLMPMLNYKSGLGVGAVGRFSSGTNHTTLAYGSAVDKFMMFGKQELDDGLYLQYAVNNYMDEWFLGRRRPKYGASLVYDKTYSAMDFLIKDHISSFKHRFDVGYFHNLDFDKGHEKIQDGGFDIGTTRFRYMAEARQNFYEYINKEELKAFRFDIATQLSSAIYGTGDTQNIGRIGPSLHMQYKRWMQDIGYFFAVYDDNSPLYRYDAFRYGKQSLYLREYFRICRWLTVSWFGTLNLSNDSPNGKNIQENGFYISVGPDDLKFNIGYDFMRENLRCTLELMMDAKGTRVEYDKFEIVQGDRTKKATKKKQTSAKRVHPSMAPTAQPILDYAVVEDVKSHEEVI